ncbi:MAG: hypothetical protein IJS60_01215 [Abditibacteriota bacterium]|nr:hypothetical protein [Abditibacteriota bacterium]
MKNLFILLILLLSCSCFALPYGIGEWQEKGHGNHRAVVNVTDPSDYNYVYIEWRRRDKNPQDKAIIIENEKGEEITDFYVKTINREYGEIIFMPTEAGKYYFYYLPYNPGVGNFDSAGTYFTPKDTSSEALKEKINNETDFISAEVSEIQARKHAEILRPDFNSMYPMEVIATAKETEELISKYTDAFLLFPEDRYHPIKMTEDIPLRWIEKGPSKSFEGTARPNEYYVFQIGVYALKDIKNLSCEFSTLTREGDSIKSSDLTCFNMGGIDWKGNPFKKEVNVNSGKVQALWIGVSVPEDAKGEYEGNIRIFADDIVAENFKLKLKVEGDVLSDRGDSDIFRLSRLRWLNDPMGIEDTVPQPWTELKYDENKIEILGRSITFNNFGLPKSIVSRDNEILRDSIDFQIVSGKKDLTFEPVKFGFKEKKKAEGTFISQSENEYFERQIESKTEFDGAYTVSVKLKAKKDIKTDDIFLTIPMNKSVAKYMMGMGMQGGFRPLSYHWQWNIVRADQQLWVGDVDAGFQLMLRHPFDTWQTLDQSDTGCPKSWDNDGKGGVDLKEIEDTVLIKAYSGEREFKKGDELEFNFRLLITPFKYDLGKHWNYRVDWNGASKDANIVHMHHGIPVMEYINYPFFHEEGMKKIVHDYMSMSDNDNLSYEAKGYFNPDRGTVHILATLNFDPHLVNQNQPLFTVSYPDSSVFDAYWCIDTIGLRSHVQIGPWQNNVYPYIDNAPAPQWEKGTQVLISYTWGDYLAIYYDGVLASNKVDFKGTHDLDLKDAVLNIGGPWKIHKVKITDTQYDGGPVDWSEDKHTLLLDTGDNNPKAKKKMGVNIYYTLRELTNMLPELYAFMSLNGEIYDNGKHLNYTDKEAVINQFGGGYPWLLEHLDPEYVPAWRQPLYFNGETDAAISTAPLSRLHNYYVHGMDYMMKVFGNDGLYLDGIGYDRGIIQRIVRVMEKNNPDYRINFHAFNPYDYLGIQLSASNQYMEHVCYATDLWNGENYDYDMPPEYWLVEISGIPFGNAAEMLEYQTGGNPYRGMVYGMTGRLLPNVAYMWRFWDDFGIKDAKWLGYWDKNCPVKVIDKDGAARKDILATAYVKKGEKTLVSIGSWARGDERVALAVNWKALGIDEIKAKAYASKIKGFQDYKEIDLEDIYIEKDKGALIIIE